MKSIFSGIVCRVLAVSLIALPWQAHAGMIGTDQAAATSAISRSDVAAQLERFGLSPEAAGERVAALSDAELSDIAGRIGALPAGGGVEWGILFAIIIVFYLAVYKPHFSDAAAATPAKPKPAPAPEKK